MGAWKKWAIGVAVMMGSVVMAQAEEVRKKKHLVDLADGMNQQEFYAAKNPDAVFSSDGSAPWTKSDAVNAWELGGARHGAVNAWEKQDDGLSRPSVTVENLQTGEVKPAATPLLENGKPLEIGTLINIRARYTLDPEPSRTSFSPVSAQSELYRQMGSHCSHGFQKLSEWSTPIEGPDYYLFYQFRCTDPALQQ